MAQIVTPKGLVYYFIPGNSEPVNLKHLITYSMVSISLFD